MPLAALLSPPVLSALSRQTRRFVAQPSLLRALDLCIAPCIDEFVFLHALQMSERELLHGAKLAALAVTDACVHRLTQPAAIRSPAVYDVDTIAILTPSPSPRRLAALHSDSSALEALDHHSAASPALLKAFADEAAHSHSHSQPVRTQAEHAAVRLEGLAVRNAMLVDDDPPDPTGAQLDLAAELSAERSDLESGAAALLGTRLIIGPHREELERECERAHKLEIGSHLVVCDCAGGHRLWSEARQRELLAEHGCTTQVSIRMGDRAYTFEAAIEGTALTGEASHELHVSLADVDGRVGSGFWCNATDATDFWSLDGNKVNDGS